MRSTKTSRAMVPRLYPAFPYASYSYLANADVLAIKAYLFSLAPIHAPPHQSVLKFPYNQRWLMAFWSAVFRPDERFQPNVEQSAQWNRGAYLSEALAHCGECHTPRSALQGLNERKKFSGAVIAGWHAYNITSDPASGIGAWQADEVAQYLSTGHAAGARHSLRSHARGRRFEPANSVARRHRGARRVCAQRARDCERRVSTHSEPSRRHLTWLAYRKTSMRVASTSLQARARVATTGRA